MRNKRIFIYVVFALMFVILSFARFMGVAPLGVGLLTALCVLKFNAPVLSLFLVLSGLTEFSFMTFTYYMTAAVVFSTLWLVERKKKVKQYWYIVCGIAAQLGFIIFCAVDGYNFVSVIVNVLLSLVYAYLCYSFGIPVLRDKLRYRVLDGELIAGGIILASLAYGLAQVPFVFPLVPFLFAVVVLFSAKVFGSASLGAGLCVGLGYALAGEVELVGAFAFMALIALLFIPAPRILSALSLILSFVMYTFFFNIVPQNGWMWLVSLLAGGLVYVLVPRGKFDAAKEFFVPDGRKALRGMVNRDRVSVGRKLQAVGGVFGEMSLIMGGGNGNINDDHIHELTQALIGSVCALCPRYESCCNSGTVDCIGEVTKAALESGRVNVADLPDKIKSGCISLASLITSSSELADRYNQSLTKLKNIDAAKKMVASQLKGISNILFNLAKKEAEPLRFDSEIEKKLIEELTYRSVVTSEALVTGDGSVMLTVLGDTLNKNTIAMVLKKMFKTPFSISKTESGNMSGWTIVYASAKPKFDVVFSVCGCPKDKDTVSGDTHSFIKIDDHRFMMAVCDGMGSGEKASGFADSTISLIENFYRAGFDHRLVLGSVNDFLTLSSEEIYSAVDIAVVDLNSGLCDIIKIGSPTSYIKTKDSVLRVDGASLPIGVLQEMKPSVVTYSLKGGETVVLSSDGAADSFVGNGMADVINNSTKLPEQLCKSVVDAALSNTGKPCDDITVAAFHIFEAA